MRLHGMLGCGALAASFAAVAWLTPWGLAMAADPGGSMGSDTSSAFVAIGGSAATYVLHRAITALERVGTRLADAAVSAAAAAGAWQASGCTVVVVHRHEGRVSVSDGDDTEDA